MQFFNCSKGCLLVPYNLSKLLYKCSFNFCLFYSPSFFRRTSNALGITNTIAPDESPWVCNGVLYGLRLMSKAHVPSMSISRPRSRYAKGLDFPPSRVNSLSSHCLLTFLSRKGMGFQFNSTSAWGIWIQGGWSTSFYKPTQQMSERKRLIELMTPNTKLVIK